MFELFSILAVFLLVCFVAYQIYKIGLESKENEVFKQEKKFRGEVRKIHNSVERDPDFRDRVRRYFKR